MDNYGLQAQKAQAYQHAAGQIPVDAMQNQAQGRLQRIMNMIGGNNGQLRAITDLVSATADHLVGQEPKIADAPGAFGLNGPERPQGPLMDEIERALHLQGEQIETLRREVQRLGQL